MPPAALANLWDTIKNGDHYNPLMRYVYTVCQDEIGQLQLALKMARSPLDAVVSRIDYSSEDTANTAQKTAIVAGMSRNCIASHSPIRTRKSATLSINSPVN